MTGAVIRVSVAESALPIPDALERLLAAAGDLSPAMKNIGEHLQASTKDRIRQEVSPDGTAFAPLNALYAQTKKGPGILRGESGDLASIVYQLAGVDAVEVGSGAVHAAIHQFGGKIEARNAPALIFSMGGEGFAVKSVTIPARPYLGVSADDEAEILAILADHFEEAAGSPGGSP